MKSRNAQLKSALGSLGTKERIAESHSIPKTDTVNRTGGAVYAVEDELRLVSMLNTLKLEPQFYRSENDTMRELQTLVEKLGIKDPYFVAQAIAWSRNCGEGMRSINHVAAALLAPFASGTEWGKRFYSLYNKNTKSGGCIFRPDDMSEIKDVYSAIGKGALTNSMKKGFASVIESLDAYQLAKYKKSVIDISNLVHPNSKKSKATMMGDNKETIKVLDAIMKGLSVSADTWEANQSEAGQIVATAVKEGKLSTEEAKAVLDNAKAENWEGLLKDGKLGYLAALRNIRNILGVCRSKESIDLLCKLLSNSDAIRKAKILPYQIDIAIDVLETLFSNYEKQIKDALMIGYDKALPNLANVLSGKTLVVLDCSGSMDWAHVNDSHKSCLEKGALVAATIAKAAKSDIMLFGSTTEWAPKFGIYDNVFDFAKKFKRNMGGTYLSSVFEALTREKKVYDRIIIISDNECYGRVVSDAYRRYVKEVCSPYIYEVDLAGYGTKPLKNDGKVQYYFGSSWTLFDDIAQNEFNPNAHIDKIRKYVI